MAEPVEPSRFHVKNVEMWKRGLSPFPHFHIFHIPVLCIMNA